MTTRPDSAARDPDASLEKLLALLGSAGGKKDPKFAEALQIVDLLIENRTDASVVNARGDSALALAVSNPNYPESILEALVGLGAAVDSKNQKGWTPLFHAAACGNLVAIKFLLDRRASVIHQDSDGKTALHWCCKRGHASIVPLLVNAGADINLGDKKDSEQRRSVGGNTPLMYAASTSEKVTKALLKFGPDVNLTDEAKQSALIHAIRGYPKNRLAIVESLLKNGARVDQSDHEGNTALHLLVQRGGFSSNPELVKALIDSGSDVNAQNMAGETPIILCRDSKNVTLLIKAGSFVNAVDKHGKTALIYCADAYSSDSDALKRAKVLLNAKCDVDIQDSEGKTALMYAVVSDGRAKTVKLLLEHGVNIDLLDNNGRPATAYAGPENLMVLIAAGAKSSTFEAVKLEEAINDDNLPLAIILMERGAQLNLRSHALFARFEKTLEKLARANADLLRSRVKSTDPEALEQLEKILDRFQRKPDVADDSDLPAILRKGAWPSKAPLRKQVVLPSARVDEIKNSINYFDGRINWPDGMKEAVLREFKNIALIKIQGLLMCCMYLQMSTFRGC